LAGRTLLSSKSITPASCLSSKEALLFSPSQGQDAEKSAKKEDFSLKENPRGEGLMRRAASFADESAAQSKS
jgi:hypothetical protein